MNSLRAFVRLSRLHFLFGGVLMYGLGASFVGVDSWKQYLLGQLLLTSSHLTAHYVNEYADYEADMSIVNRTAFSGGSGALTSGALAPVIALRAAYVTSTICLGCVAVVLFSAPVAAGVALITLAVSWAYSIPPFRLVGTGWGELATALTVGGLYPILGALAQDNTVPEPLWWAVAVLIPMQFIMLLGFELPDLDSDARAGKRVLGVRIGRRRTVVLMATVSVATVVVGLVAWQAHGLPSSVILGALTALPVLIAVFPLARRGRYGLTTLASVAAFALCGTGMLVGSLLQAA